MQATRFFALGGMQEIGKTTLVIEYDEEIVIIDAGIKFASSMELGVDGMIPDYSYLRKNQHKIKGLFITHGHEDHIGGIPYLLQFVDIPAIHAPKVAIEFIQERLKEFKIGKVVNFVEITAESVFTFENLSVDFWTSQHSIPDSFGIRVKTPNGNIFDTGDFRFDYTPIGNLTDFSKLEKMATEGIDILISDSTNAMSPDHSPTEQKIIADIEKYVSEAEGKIIFTTFASNLTRVKIIIDLAVKYKKKIIPFGRSMVRAVEIGQKLKYLTIPAGTLVDKRDINKFQDKELLILSTGSQGEEMAALAKMAEGKHPYIILKDKDIVIFSSSAIPGNKVKVELLVNALYKTGAETRENKIDGMLHTSGHAYKAEHNKIFSVTKPKYFIPYHGAYRQSAVHGYTAIESGFVNENNVIIIANGDVVELKNHEAKLTNEKIETGPIYIDSNMAVQGNSDVIKTRELLSINGFINVVVTVNRKTNEIVGRAKVISRGAIFVKESRDIMNEVQRLAHGGILYTIKNKPNWTKADIKENVKSRIEPFFYQKKRRNPLILTSIIEI